LPDFAVQIDIAGPQKVNINLQGVSQMHIADGEAIPLRTDHFEVRDYKWEDIIATLCIQEDRYATGLSPATVTETVDQVRRLVIYTPGGERQDWLAKDTIVDIDGSFTAVRSTVSAFLNNQSDRLRWQANLHALWYLVPRAILTIQSARPSAVPAVGQLLTTLNATREHAATINTIVSEITLRIPIAENGDPGPPTYTLRTADYSDLHLPI
jgi:hypothetical protein